MGANPGRVLEVIENPDPAPASAGPAASLAGIHRAQARLDELIHAPADSEDEKAARDQADRGGRRRRVNPCPPATHPPASSPRPRFTWPDGHRCAAMLCFDVDGETTALSEDPPSPAGAR
jgi:hypothetical protein